MDETLGRLIDRSWALDADIRAMFTSAKRLTNVRGLATMGLCEAAMQHAASQRILVVAGCDVAAMALVRLHYESVVRALWLQVGATDDWIDKFTAPMAAEPLAEPILGPSVDAMLNRTGPSRRP